MDRKTDLRLWAVLFWLAVWQIAAMALAAVYPHGELLLASPVDVLLRLGQLAVTAAFLLLAAGYFLGARSGTEPYRVEALSTAAETVALPRPSETAAPETAEATPDKVNINTASAEELDTLPGIGAQRAADIIADREANGPFRIPEDLTRVPGIGEGILEGLIDYITVE